MVMKKKLVFIGSFLLIIILFLSFVMADSSLNPLTVSLANTLYCSITGNNCGLSLGEGDITFINIESSLVREVLWNISSVEETEYVFKLRDGRHWVITGGEI